jgi:hypothetical protein
MEVMSGRTKGRQFTSAASRRGQTGSNWSSVDRRLDAEAQVNALGEADHARSRSQLAASASTRSLAVSASSSAPKPWVPNNPGAKSTGAGSFEGTFRGKPFKYIAPEVELKGPPPKLLHNPPQLLASGARRGGPGTATRGLSSFPYESDAHPWPSKPARPELAPRSFLAGKPRSTLNSDQSLYSLDGFRPPQPQRRR